MPAPRSRCGSRPSPHHRREAPTLGPEPALVLPHRSGTDRNPAAPARSLSLRAMETQPVLPDLDGASVAGLIPALIGGRPAPWMPEAVRDAKSVVLLVLDGLGANEIEARPQILKELAGDGRHPDHDGRAVDHLDRAPRRSRSLAPKTRILGWMLVGDDVLNVLRQTAARPVPDPFHRSAPRRASADRVPVVTRPRVPDLDLPRRRIWCVSWVEDGWATLYEQSPAPGRSGREARVRLTTRELTSRSMRTGLHDEFYAGSFGMADLLVEPARRCSRLRRKMPDRRLITGWCNLEPESWIEIDELAPR